MNHPKLRDVLGIICASEIVTVIVELPNDDGGYEQVRIWRGFPEYVSIDKLEADGAVYVTTMFSANNIVLVCREEDNQ